MSDTERPLAELRAAVNAVAAAVNALAATGEKILAKLDAAEVKPELPAWFTPVEAARYLCVGRSTFFHLVSAGGLPRCRVSGRLVRYSRKALDRYMSKRERVSGGRR